jgi:hypothetical protein
VDLQGGWWSWWSEEGGNDDVGRCFLSWWCKLPVRSVARGWLAPSRVFPAIFFFLICSCRMQVHITLINQTILIHTSWKGDSTVHSGFFQSCLHNGEIISVILLGPFDEFREQLSNNLPSLSVGGTAHSPTHMSWNLGIKHFLQPQTALKWQFLHQVARKI